MCPRQAQLCTLDADPPYDQFARGCPRGGVHVTERHDGRRRRVPERPMSTEVVDPHDHLCARGDRSQTWGAEAKAFVRRVVERDVAMARAPDVQCSPYRSAQCVAVDERDRAEQKLFRAKLGADLFTKGRFERPRDAASEALAPLDVRG